MSDALKDFLKGHVAAKGLSFAHGRIGDLGVLELVEHLARTTCEFVDLTGCEITGRGAKHFSYLLKRNPQLVHLVLKWNPFTIDLASFDEFCLGLAENRSVRSLDLRNTEMGVEAAASLARAIQSPYTILQEVDVSWNAIGVQGATKLVHAIKSNTNIMSLEMHGCDAGEQNLLEVEELVKRNRYARGLFGLFVPSRPALEKFAGGFPQLDDDGSLIKHALNDDVAFQLLKKSSAPQTTHQDAVLCKQLYAVVTKKKLQLQDEKKQQIALDDHRRVVQEGHRQREQRYEADLERLRAVAKEHTDTNEQLHQKVRVAIEKLAVAKASARAETQSYQLFVERCKTEEETLQMRFEEVMRENRQLKLQVGAEEEHFIGKKHDTEMLVKGIEYILQRSEMRRLDLAKLDEEMEQRRLESYRANEELLDDEAALTHASTIMSHSGSRPGTVQSGPGTLTARSSPDVAARSSPDVRKSPDEVPAAGPESERRPGVSPELPG